jgi:hypothetical protein
MRWVAVPQRSEPLTDPWQFVMLWTSCSCLGAAACNSISSAVADAGRPRWRRGHHRSNVRIGSGTTVDIPLAHKDNIWSSDRLDTLTVSMPDAPEEMVAPIAIADGGRPHPRVGKERI